MVTLLAVVLLGVGAYAAAAAGGGETPSGGSGWVVPAGNAHHESESESAPSKGEGHGPDEAAGADFSACAGMTGLENAICRVSANHEAHPQSPGLTNALDELRANLDRQGSTAGNAPRPARPGAMVGPGS